LALICDIRLGPGFEHGYPRHFIAAAWRHASRMFSRRSLLWQCGRGLVADDCWANQATSILTRLSAFILLAIGIQILWTGLSLGIPQMLGPAAH